MLGRYVKNKSQKLIDYNIIILQFHLRNLQNNVLEITEKVQRELNVSSCVNQYKRSHNITSANYLGVRKLISDGVRAL